MDVEVLESELPRVSVETGSEEKSSFSHEKENGKTNQEEGLNEPIKFGSHNKDEQIKVEMKNVPVANLPQDAVDEWPAPKQIHSFYFMKYRSYDDQKLKAKLDQADKELQKKNQARFQITEKLRAIRADRAQVIAQFVSLNAENKQFRTIMDEKRKEMEPLQQALGKLRGTNNVGRERGISLCSSEEELNNLIKSFQYHIQHESIPLSEEKQLLREIKQLEGTREKVIAYAAMKAKIQDSMGEKEDIQDQVKLIGVDLDGVRKEQQVVKAKRKQLDEEKEAIEKQINSLQEELTVVTQKRDKTFDNIQELRTQREEGNTCFYQNRTLLIKARELAAKKDIEALKKLSDSEVDKFTSLYSSSNALRDDYEKRILPSLDIRQMSRDGRMRNPDEKPLVLQDTSTPSQPEIVAKTNLKQPKEDSISHLQHNTSSIEKVQKEKSSKHQKEAKDILTESTMERSDLEEGEGISGLEKLQKNPPKGNEADESKLKEMKREEEMAKAKQALERKKKLAEKATAKAAIKSQKEAEKKLKEREKRAKKKAGASVPASEPEEPTEVAAEVAEPENGEDNVETPAVPPRYKDRKENALRYRSRGKGPDSLSKIILKRKKSTNYWVWAVPAAFLVLIILAVGYYYSLNRYN